MKIVVLYLLCQWCVGVVFLVEQFIDLLGVFVDYLIIDDYFYFYVVNIVWQVMGIYFMVVYGEVLDVQ